MRCSPRTPARKLRLPGPYDHFKTSKPLFKSKKKAWNNPSEWVIFKRIYEDNISGKLPKTKIMRKSAQLDATPTLAPNVFLRHRPILGEALGGGLLG